MRVFPIWEYQVRDHAPVALLFHENKPVRFFTGCGNSRFKTAICKRLLDNGLAACRDTRVIDGLSRPSRFDLLLAARELDTRWAKFRKLL
jgi:hypothetical protein